MYMLEKLKKNQKERGKLSKSFREGYKYVFTKKKHVKDQGKSSFKWCKGWVNECNGREVKIINENNGKVGDYFIFPEWCKCIGKEG